MVWYPGEAEFVDEAGLPSRFSTVMCCSGFVRGSSPSFCLDL